MTKMDLDKIVVEWHHHPPLTYPHELFAYAVVCTPTDEKLGPTLTTVRGNINRTEVHRLRPRANYSWEIVALVIDNQTEEITLEKSQRNSLETDEGGETILVIEIFGTSRPPPPTRASRFFLAHFVDVHFTTSNLLMRRFMKDLNTRRRIPFSFFEAR